MARVSGALYLAIPALFTAADLSSFMIAIFSAPESCCYPSLESSLISGTRSICS